MLQRQAVSEGLASWERLLLGQSVHTATSMVGLYFPTAHAVQKRDPVNPGSLAVGQKRDPVNPGSHAVGLRLYVFNHVCEYNSNSSHEQSVVDSI